jgi:peptide/nickel transport system substrate-binding protein
VRGGNARLYFPALAALTVCVAASLPFAERGMSGPISVRQGGVVRVAVRGADIDSLDPALSYSVASWSLLDPTCALLMRPAGKVGLQPEVAAGPPRISDQGRTYTFTLRSGFRFSDGKPVRASAFAAAIDRMLAPRVRSPWAAYLRGIVGGEDVLAGRARTARGVVAKGDTLIVRLTRPAPDFPAWTTFICAVPPTLPADREGVVAFPAAGPYFIAEYRPNERVVLQRNPFYGGKRDQHVDGFSVDLRVTSQEEVLDRIESGKVDWGWALPQVYFDPERRLAEKYGVNRSQFFVHPGLTWRGYAFNTSRPMFRNNPKLRQAVSYAVDRSALRRAAGGRYSSRLTDQYLPPSIAGFRDARIYPLSGPDLDRARALARGHMRGGKVVLYTIDLPNHLSFAQSVKRNLGLIGLDVTIKAVPLQAYFGKLMVRGPYDLGFATWTADYQDPYAILNAQLESRFIGSSNPARFDSPLYDRLLRHAAGLEGVGRYRAYGDLDVRLARDAAPMIGIDVLNDAILVSKRLGCVRQPFELASLCLK